MYCLSQRLPSYRGYSTVSMENANEAVVKGTMSVRKAAAEHSVSQSTLHEKVAGRLL